MIIIDCLRAGCNIVPPDFEGILKGDAKNNGQNFIVAVQVN